MVEAYVIIGAMNTHKSATIRALTGVRDQQTTWNVRWTDSSKDMTTYVEPRSLQEKGIDAAAFAKFVGASGSKRVIFALRPEGKHSGGKYYEGAEHYLEQLRKKGWRIKGLIELSGPYNISSTFTVSSNIDDSINIAGNEIAHLIKPYWPIL